MAEVDFPAWAWAWVVAGAVAVPLLLAALLRRGTRPPGAPAAGVPQGRRLYGRALLWWALGVLALAAAELLESDALTVAALGALAVGYAILVLRRALGPGARLARASALAGAAVVLGYIAVLALRAGQGAWAILLGLGTTAIAIAAGRIAYDLWRERRGKG